MTDGAGAAGDEHDAAVERPGDEPVGSVLVHGQRTVGGHGGDAEAGADVVRRSLGQPDDPVRGLHGVLGGGATGAVVLGQEDPHAVADLQAP